MSNVVKDKSKAVTAFSTALFDVPDVPTSPKITHLNDMRAEARRQGHAEGYATGLEQGNAEGQELGYANGMQQAREMAAQERAVMFEKLALEIEAVLRSAKQAIPEWCRQAEEELTTRVTDICREILMRELELDRSSVLTVVSKAMSVVTHSREARIRVNPADYQLLMEHREELTAAARSIDGVTIVPDSNVSGGCTIDTDGGSVEASHEARLRVIETRLKEDAA